MEMGIYRRETRNKIIKRKKCSGCELEIGWKVTKGMEFGQGRCHRKVNGNGDGGGKDLVLKMKNKRI